MNWVARRKEMGVPGRELACFYLLLLLIMSQLEAPCYAAGHGRFGSSNGGSISELKKSPARSTNIGGLKGNADKDGDEIFGAEKRKLLLANSTVNVSSSLTDVYESLGFTATWFVAITPVAVV
ncbi:hypothetical protein DKX38_023621 [Salix brachista]|uniref:Uncharacterized protein n=1 Tax=Salix brachista TaxID=2182728 RepID=A0A5N5JK96_9ROSI|nr:hypothetical protein DKX38_023621 [Salix brachista]